MILDIDNLSKFVMKWKFTPGKSFSLHIISGHVSKSMQRKSRFWPLLTQQTHINPPESFYAETMSEWNTKIMLFSFFYSSPIHASELQSFFSSNAYYICIDTYTKHSKGTIISVSTHFCVMHIIFDLQK